nr:hypothetical protein [Acidimicrobiia bacterium]
PLPGGGLYLWCPAPDGDAWAFAGRLAADAGCLVAPGELFGPTATGHVRIAMVQSDERIEVVARRLGVGVTGAGPIARRAVGNRSAHQ